ncbi:MAG: molybdopterin molybdotransferase MoeA [Bacteroidetes bacterium]|nr:molybdopterin molybdotransferase MoeA [Bacteroidota bacterium]
MITVKEALDLVIDNTPVLGIKKITLKKALGGRLAADIKAPLDLPPFDQSAMDGYAIVHDKATKYKLTGEVKTGGKSRLKVKKGEAARIFTGAAVPKGADSVVIQEHVTSANGNIEIDSPGLKLGANIRIRGSQISKGELAMKKDTVITPAGIGFIASMGLRKVQIYGRPRVSILVTGDELIRPGKKYSDGKIYESNSFALHAALKEMGVRRIKSAVVPDHFKATKKAIKRKLKKADILIVSGGISVGDHDHVGKVLDELNSEEIFYKVAQKPGKPMYFGRNNNTLIFALPGNPASALVCFYEYVYPAIRKMMGHEAVLLEKETAKLSNAITKSGDRITFFRGFVKNGKVQCLEGQGSHIMKSFAVANCLIKTEANRITYKAGSNVEVHRLP